MLGRQKFLNKMNKKISVTVGIPAYNEEKNIKNAINSVLAQKHSNFNIEKIIVISDGSSDKTIRTVKLLKNNLLKIINGKVRKGKPYRLNQVFNLATSEILVLLDADCVLEQNAISNMVTKFIDKNDVALVSGNAVPVDSNSLIPRIIKTGVQINKSASEIWNKGKNVYTFRGSFLGIRKSLYKNVVIPPSPGTDAYLFFSAMKNKYEVNFSKKSIVYYRLPEALIGHIRQSSRFILSQSSMYLLFGEEAKIQYNLPKSILIKELFKVFLVNPIYTALFIVLRIVIKINSKIRKRKISGVWEIANSTKKEIVINEKK